MDVVSAATIPRFWKNQEDVCEAAVSSFTLEGRKNAKN